MTRIREIKTTFTAGEVGPELLGRGDLRAYKNGALTLSNVFIQPTGGVKRRSGMAYVDDASGDGRLIAFEFNTEQNYLLVVTDGLIDIYADGVKEASVTAPWTVDQIANLVWTQSADTLLMVHPEVPPKRLLRTGVGVWSLEDWEYYTENDVIYLPFYKYATSGSSITPSATTGNITLTCSEEVFEEEHEGTRLRVQGCQVEITDYDSATVVTAEVIEELPDTDTTIDWYEQAFSDVHGYPTTVAFNQDRLVIGGSRDLPNRMWFSKSGDLFNFDQGEGLDDESIEFGILSDQVNAIRGIFSGRHLQVFTSGAEWVVTGDPITPSDLSISRQTRVGAIVDRYIAPVNVDGATIFVARNLQEIREFLYTDLEEAYQATDLALLSRHLIVDPIDQDFDQIRRLLFLVRGDGKLATLTIFRSEQVAAWTLHETDGEVKSVSVVGEDVYLLVKRGDNYTIEEFDDDLYLDSALSGTVDEATDTWAGLDHLEGETVSVVADGIIQSSLIVQSGKVILESAANEVQIGLPYTHIVEPLPPSETGEAGGARKVRLIQAVFRLYETCALRLDVGRGLRDMSLRRIGESDILGDSELYSGDITVRAFGWKFDGTEPLWRIEQDAPLPFMLLSVTTEMKVND